MADVALPAMLSTIPLVDDHDWAYPSIGVQARARLRAWRTASEGYLTLVTDLLRGTSIINASESVHAALVERFGPRITVIGHSPGLVPNENDWFYLITIKPDGVATWAPLSSVQTLVDLLGPQVTTGLPGEEFDNEIEGRPAAVYATRMTSAAIRLTSIVGDEDLDMVLHAIHTTQHQIAALADAFEDELTDDLLDTLEEPALLVDLECLRRNEKPT